MTRSPALATFATIACAWAASAQPGCASAQETPSPATTSGTVAWPSLPATSSGPASPPAPSAASGDQISVNGDTILSAFANGLDAKGEILVVAKRIKGQVVADQPPLVTLDEEDIAAYGVASIEELVSALVPQTGTGRGRGDGTPVFLVNGMRILNFREMRGLPPEAIRMVEILPEEVALKYGSRPDQRVVNFVLKDHFRSFGNELEGSTPTRGGYDKVRDEATIARIEKGARFNLTGTFSAQSAETEAARDIIQSSSATGGGEAANFRTLSPRTTSAILNGTLAKPLGEGAGLTINGLVERDSSDALNGLRSTEPLIALLTATRTTTVSTGAGLNQPLGNWLLSVTLDASHVDSASGIDTTSSLVPQVADSVTDTVTQLATASGSALRLPGGQVAVTVKGGVAWSGIASFDSRTGNGDTRMHRAEPQTGFSVDLPITSRKEHFGEAIGDLSLNLNSEVHHVSDFGTLLDFGAGLSWKPTEKLALQATFIGTDAAPTLSNLAAPSTATPDVTVYDFVAGQSVLATVVTGGNRDLAKEKQRDFKASANWTLPFLKNSTFIVEYYRNHSTNAISTFPLLTGAVEQAYGDRITRSASTGQIIAIDESPINVAETLSSRIRTSLNLDGNFGKPDPNMKRSGFGRGFGGPPPGGPPPGGPGGGGQGGGGRGGGFGRGPGGPGGPGGPPPSDGRGRWNLSVAYSLELMNTARLVAGGDRLDMLRGDALTGTGVARHTVQLDGGGFYRGYGLRMNATYTGATHVNGSGTADSTRLDFGALATVNLRLFADLGRMPKLVKKAPFLKGARLSLGFDNLFDGQQKVRDQTGATPLRYQAGYLDPAGRVIKLELRKQF